MFPPYLLRQELLMEKEQMLLSHFENLYLLVAVARDGIRTRVAVVTFRSLDH